MKIKDLLVRNFRAIKNLELQNLGNTIVIAGSNGCGKTQIYHALRLLKSTYGGYQQNEYQQWWGEFQINLNRPSKEINRIFRDQNFPIHIRGTFEITQDERTYLLSTAENQIRTKLWEERIPDYQSFSVTKGAAFAHAQRIHGPDVENKTQEELKELKKYLRSTDLVGDLKIHPNLKYEAQENVALELMFSTYDPTNLGIIDYHGAQRTYNRQQIGGINLNIKESEDRGRQHSLYNYSNKFSNIKSELAAGYVRDLIASQAGAKEGKTKSLTKTLQELFSTFFPGKEFPGPSPGPDGTLDFPVLAGDKTEHDIDDLSSGEKEVLFGYLRLRNSAPKNSVMLIDEPELHLNPALLQGLPQFYHRHIGRDLGNQLWLVTHSDTLLREAVGQPGFSVFHMRQARSINLDENQIKEIHVGEPLDRAVIDLVGDLATYQPGGKVVIFEGGGDIEFDVRMTTSLFPRLHVEVTTISAGDKGKVQQLHNLLKRASDSGSLGSRFYSIVDRDSGFVERGSDSFAWDRYHIENYLLKSKFLLLVLDDLNIQCEEIESTEAITRALKECAKETLDGLVRHELESIANSTLMSAIKTNISRREPSIAKALNEAVVQTKERIDDATKNELGLAKLEKEEKKIRNQFLQHLKSDKWLSTFRGRDILRRFVNNHVKRVKYEVFRDLIISKMRDKNYEPKGMKDIIDEILKS